MFEGRQEAETEASKDCTTKEDYFSLSTCWLRSQPPGDPHRRACRRLIMIDEGWLLMMTDDHGR
eukprot:3387274-Karenia_brevis.AAC.1